MSITCQKDLSIHICDGLWAFVISACAAVPRTTAQSSGCGFALSVTPSGYFPILATLPAPCVLCGGAFSPNAWAEYDARQTFGPYPVAKILTINFAWRLAANPFDSWISLDGINCVFDNIYFNSSFFSLEAFLNGGSIDFTSHSQIVPGATVGSDNRAYNIGIGDTLELRFIGQAWCGSSDPNTLLTSLTIV